jgi:hypothetical protein
MRRRPFFLIVLIAALAVLSLVAAGTRLDAQEGMLTEGETPGGGGSLYSGGGEPGVATFPAAATIILEPTEATYLPTPSLFPTATVTQPPTELYELFFENFDRGNSPLSQIRVELGQIFHNGLNYSLRFFDSQQPAQILTGFAPMNGIFKGEFILQSGRVQLGVRQRDGYGYQLSVDALGNVNLSRNGVVVAFATISPQTHLSLQLSAFDNEIIGFIDQVEVVRFIDEMPLPLGWATLQALDSGSDGVVVDDIQILVRLDAPAHDAGSGVGAMSYEALISQFEPNTMAVYNYEISAADPVKLGRIIYAYGGPDTDPLHLNNGYRFDSPRISPNGMYVAFSCDISGPIIQLDICVLNLQTQAVFLVTQDTVFDTNPTWSPDGSRLAFERLVGNYDYIWEASINFSQSSAYNLRLVSSQPCNEPTWGISGIICQTSYSSVVTPKDWTEG